MLTADKNETVWLYSSYDKNGINVGQVNGVKEFPMNEGIHAFTSDLLS